MKHDQSLVENNSPSFDNLEVAWRPQDELTRMIRLSVLQLESALAECNTPVNTLMDTIAVIGNASSGADSVNTNSSSPAPIENETKFGHCQIVSDQVKKSIVALQFHDRLTQRLQHIGDMLSKIGALVDDPEQLNSKAAWDKLLIDTQSEYSMENERDIFDSLF